MKLYDFTVENRMEPIGFDRLPRFSWKLESDDEGVWQEAYALVVKEQESGHECWNSGICQSEQSLYIPYAGEALRPFFEYDVTLQVWDNKGKTDEITTRFETGLLDEKNWQGVWIGSTWEKERTCPVIYRDLQIKKKVKKARVYMTALGVYDLLVDEKKIGNAYFAPGWTSYQHRLQYQTYDITDALEEGEHRLSVMLGPGWYAGYLNGEGQRFFYGKEAAVRAMIGLFYEDGTKEILATDETWKIRDSVIAESEFYHGEIQDFRSVDAKSRKVEIFADQDLTIGKIVAQECQPVSIQKRLPVVKKWIAPNGDLLLDFGQVLPGFVEVILPTLSGEELCLEYAETLDKHGNIYRDNLRTAKCRDIYRYGKDEVGCLVRPHFTYRGFRYVRLKGVSEKVDAKNFVACVLYTHMPQRMDFSCSNEKVQRLQENVMWSQRCNFVDIPTDCPQRDERLGWTGDAAIFCQTGMQQFDASLFYEKYMRDVAAETDDSHGVPHVVPNILGPATGTAVWSDAATILPWMVYQYSGDRHILEEQYANMRQWVEYVHRNAGEDILWLNGFQRGDWLALDSDMSLQLMSGGTDKNLVANVYYAYSTKIVSDAAEILGKEEEHTLYAKRYEAIVKAFLDEYVTKTGRLVTETQTACALLLYFDLVQDKRRERIFQALTDNLRAHQGRLTTGFVGTAFLCHVLSDNGRHDLAEKLLLNEKYPGWLYEVERGATTIWERWNSIQENGDFDASGMNSLNHYSYGTIADFLYRKVGGIELIEAGYKKVRIRPVLTQGMTQVKMCVETPYGKLMTRVQCADGQISVDVEIPVNTSAILYLPEKDGSIILESGKYHYAYETNTDLLKEKLTMQSFLRDVLARDGGREAFEKASKNPLDDGMLAYLSGKTLEELAAMIPGGKDIMQQVICTLQ